MAGFGYFLQGLARGLQQAQERKRQQAEDAIRQDYLKSQKKILDAQVKAQEIEEAWWNSQPEDAQQLRFLPKEMQSIAMMMAGMKGLPSLKGAQSLPLEEGAMSTNEGTYLPSQGGIVQPGATEEATGGFPEMASNIMGRSLWKKMFGLDPGELSPRTIKSAKTGRPVTQFFDISGNPVGPEIEEPTKFDKIDITGAKGTSTLFIDPYNPQKALGTIQEVTSAMQGGQPGLMTKPPTKKTVKEQLTSGETVEYEINEVTGEKIPGSMRIAEQPKGQEAEKAGKFTMAQNSLDEITATASSFFNPDGTLNRKLLTQSKVNLPFSKGRSAKQAFKRALETSIRIMSGAAVPETEVTRYLDMFMPDVLDSDEAAKAKVDSLYKFLNGLITQMDPTGQLQLRSVEARGKKLKTPTSLKQEDPLGIR